MNALCVEWVRKADADLGAAGALMRRRAAVYPDQVCFLCQQSAEKYLKAFLSAREVGFPRIHKLLQLNDMCTVIDADFARLTDDLARLDLYAVEIRYPGLQATIDDARLALASARRVRRFVERKITRPTTSPFPEVNTT